MEQTPEIIYIKNEPSDSTSTEENDTSSIMQEDECLAKSAIYIKKEPFEDECQFPAIASTSHDLSPTEDTKLNMYEPIIGIQTIKEEVEMMDPLAENDEIRAVGIKPEPSSLESDDEAITQTENSREEQERLWKINKPELIGSMLLESNYEYQLLVTNESGRRRKKYVCNECHKVFGYKCEVEKHLRIHNNMKPYECEICQKSFKQKGNLTNHILTHSGEKTHVCEICKKVFSRRSSLKTHKMIHTGIKPFSCSMCDKMFNLKSSLLRHERTHTGEKPYACEYCDKTFSDESSLRTHRRIHTGVKPYSCEICYKAFTQKAVLTKHKRVIHKITSTTT